MIRNNSVQIRTKMKIVKGKPDLTPLVDVLFLLLIFFMLSSSFVQVSGIKVDLPETQAQGTQGIEKFVVTIDNKSHYFFNDQPVKWNLLKEKLIKVHSSAIVIRADKMTPFGAVAKLMSFAEHANLNAFVATIRQTDEVITFAPDSDE
jgi:biopolymer transport protein ExbD